MHSPNILPSFRDQLAQAVQSHTPQAPKPLNISPWVAMSMLQKAIRRGHEIYALEAVATLLLISPERLWRRCAVAAFEDAGTADLETISIATAALAGKQFRARIGGEWAVASYIVSRMVNAPKCRAADDLLMIAERHPAYEKGACGHRVLGYFAGCDLERRSRRYRDADR